MRLKEEDERSARMACSDFETLFAAQMIGINRKNGSLRVSLSFAATLQCVSQLRNESSCAAKWHSCAKTTFAITKYPAEWDFCN